MSFLTFPVTGNYQSLAPGGVIRGIVRFTPNVLPGIPPRGVTDGVTYGVMTEPVFGTIVNGVLFPQSSFATTVTLTSNDPQLNLAGALQYTVDFLQVTADGRPLTVNPFTFNAPDDSTPVDLPAAAPGTPLQVVMGLPSVPVSGLSDATTYSKGFLTGPTDAATARTYLGITGAGGVLEFTNLAAFPGTGIVDTIYYAQDTHKFYIWNGSSYDLTNPPAVTSVAGLSGAVGASALTDALTDGSVNKVYSASDKTRLASTSGTNTGDQTNITGNAATATVAASTSGNAATATKLATARNINGVAFDGTAAITVADATKEPAITAAATTTIFRGDKTFVTLNQDIVPDGTTNKAYSAADKTRLANTSGTNTGDQTSIVGITGTTAQFNTANTDGDFATLAGTETLSGKTFTAPALGTPASGTLTNCTGLPVAGGGTGAATLTGIVKGNGTAAFTAATAGTDYTSPSSTETQTNKRVTKRVLVVTQAAIPTFNTDNADVISITGLAQTITSMTTNQTGTPAAGDILTIQITDSGSLHSITWGTKFEAGPYNTLPPNTFVASQMMTCTFLWNAVTSKWRLMSVETDPRDFASTPRVTSNTSTTAPTLSLFTDDQLNVTSLAVNATVGIVGTGTDGRRIRFRFKDNGTARTIAWSASFVAGPAALLTTTVVNMTHLTEFFYDSAAAKWVCTLSHAAGY